jgi:hypothetical protein
MKRLLRGGLRALADHCVRPLWRSLVAFGATYAGTATYCHALLAPALASHSCDPFARYAPGGLQLLPQGPGGPPPAHPERLCEDIPLCEQERLLVRELWPAYHSERRAADDD